MKTRKRKLDPVKDEVIRMYLNGFYIREIGNKFNVSQAQVCQFLKLHGVKTRPPGKKKESELKTREPERFWSKVNKAEDCWEWTGSRSPSGYGQFKVKENSMTAHRYSWELHNGEIPEGQCVCHKCDNTACVRPDHLFLGTHGDNMKDAVKKGRLGQVGAKGKLSYYDVIAIKHALAQGLSLRTIAPYYKVSPVTISKIKNNQIWKEV
jgi:transposase